MPTVVFMSPKGGAGKTTSALLFSLALARLYDVTIIDADPIRSNSANAGALRLLRRRGRWSACDRELRLLVRPNSCARSHMWP